MKNTFISTLFTALIICIANFANATTYTVTDTLDTNTAGTFRKAINDANANPGADIIQFNIAGTWSHNIILSSALPTITGPTVIDGTTQPGFVSGTQASYVKVGKVYTGTILVATSVTGITIKGLDLSYTSVRSGSGISLTNCNQSFILDNFIRNRNSGIVINGGQDHTVQNNDLFATSSDYNNPALYFLNITQASISGGIAASGNKFGGSGLTALRVQNMSNLIIGDASVSGANIIIEDNSGLTDMGNSGHYVFYLITVNNITIDNIDISWLGGGQRQSVAIYFENQVTNSTIKIKNCSIQNRWDGILCNNGKDYTIQNNDLKGTGENGGYAISLSNITAAALPGGVLMSGNLFGRNTNGVESKGGVKLSNMNNLTIGDASTGVQIKIEDNSGFNKINGNSTGDRGALFLQNVSNIVVDNLDASWTLGGITNCFGIRINNSGSNGNITIKNCDVRNHYLGIYCGDGKDYKVFNNDLRGCGHEDNAALQLNNIAEGAISGGVLVYSNLYGRNPTGPIDPNSIGLLVQAMSNLTIGDATTGVEIKIEDNSGMNTFGGNTADRRGAIYLDDVSNIVIDDLDLSYTLGGVPNAFGIYVENETGRNSNISTPHRNITIKNCLVRNRSEGIRIRGGKDYSVFNNDLRGSGHNGYYAMELGDIQTGTIPGGVLVYSNLFGTNGAQVSNNGVFIQYMNDLIIGDAITGVNIKLEDNSGLNQIVGDDFNNRGALYLNNVNNITVDNLDCSKFTSGQGNSWGVRVANTVTNSNITIKNCLAGNRQKGIWIDGGLDYTVTNNNLVGSGGGNSAAALELSNIIPGTLAGGIVANGNTFGTPNFNRGVVISGMRNLLIGDASVMGANIVLEDNSGLNQCVGNDYNNQGALFMSNVDSVTVDNVDCSKVMAGQGNSYGIYVSNGIMNQSVTIKNCKADNRQRGINCRNGKDYTVQNNTITNSGSDGEACALDFRDVTAGTLTGGVLVSGNTFGNSPISANLSRAGVRFDNLKDLTIGDATTGVNVKLEDGNGLTSVGYDQNSNYSVIALNNIYNSSIDNVDVSSSFTTPAQRNIGIRISNNLSNGTITVKDCNIQNRRTGLYINGGKDYTVTGNNFTGCGNNSGEPAIWLNSIVKGSLNGGIAMSTNTFGGTSANDALRIDDMKGFTIGDNATYDISLEDGTSGLNAVGTIANSNDYVLYLNQISNVTINSVDLSRSGGTQQSVGLRIVNGNGNKTISITNNTINNRRTGIYISGGVDYTLTGNTLTGSGLAINEPAIYLNGILEGSLTGGLSMNTNTFGGTNSNSAVRFESMKNLTIGDASVSGTNVIFEDVSSGLATTGNTANSNDPVLYFVNVANSSIDNVDLTRTGSTQYGIGLRIDNNASYYPFSIKNCSIKTRRTGIYVNGSSGYTIQNNDLSGSGNNTSEPALYMLNATFSAGKTIYDNTFGGTNFAEGLRLDNINDVIIGDETVSNVQIELKSTSGIKEATSRAIDLETCNRIKVELVQLSLTSGGPSGTGLYVNGGSHVTAKSLTIHNRVDALDILSGASHTVQCSDISSNTDGLQVASGVTGLTVEQNTFLSNTGYAIQSAATIKAENNYFGGGAPPVGVPPNAVTATTDVTPYLTSAPSGCPVSGGPEIEVVGNLNLVEDNSTTPSTLNYTDFNSAKPSTSVIRTFTINNIGGLDLNISSISFTGSEASDFVAGTLTPASPIPAGSSATFTVTFTPGATGVRNATLNIANDDTDEAAFDAAVKGTGKSAIVVTNINDSGAGSLRQAITDANLSSDADVIEFAIGSGAQTITNSSTLPTITQPLIIDGSSQPGFAGTPLITVNSNNNFTTFTATSVTGLTIKYMNLSRPSNAYDGNGIDLNTCNEVFILNNIINNRFSGIFSNGGRDHTLQNNDLKATGVDANRTPIYLSGLTSRLIPGGVKISGNLYGDAIGNNRSRFGFRITNMSNLIVGDASVVGANITIEDGSGLGSAGTGDNYTFYMSSVSNITIDNLDLTATTYGYQGWGIRIDNGVADGNITIKNCKINNRYSGITCNSGRDYTIQNNDLQKCGNDASRPDLWLSNIKGVTIPKGILASGNLYGDASGLCRVGLRIDGMTDLLIGNQTVGGANITIEDASGMKAAAPGDNYAIYLLNVSNITMDKIDLTSTIGYQGWGIRIENSANNSNITVKNCKINGRYSAVYCGSGKDYTIINNDFKNTSNDNSRPAIWFNGVRPGILAGGVTASGNSFGSFGQTAQTALRLDGMDGLIIGDSLVAGANIVLEDHCGANSMNSSDVQAVIYMNGVSNITVDNVDVSRSASGRDGTGIYIENGNSSIYRNITIKNCKSNQHTVGLWVNGGKDVTVKDNDFRYSGYYADRPAVYLNSILAGSLPGGIDMSGNLFGGTFNGSITHLGLRIDNMRDVIIGNVSVVGRNITIEDASGMNNVIGEDVNNRGCIYMNNVRNVQIKNVDMSKAPSGQGNSFALWMNNCINVLVKDCKGSNRQKGFEFVGGRDYTVLNNDLDSTGVTKDNPALWFSGITPQLITTGVSASGNIFGAANVRTGLRVDGMKGIIIGDASVSGAHIVIEDGSGMNNMIITDNNSNDPAIYLTNVTNTTIDNIDASRAGTKDRSGIWVNNNANNYNITIKNCNFNNHRRAIYCSGGRDYTIQNNTMLNAGDNTNNSEPAVLLQNIQSGSLTGGILMSGNSFGGTTSFGALRCENMRDLVIGDVSVAGRNITLEDGCGLNNMGGNGNNSVYYVLQLVNVNNATVDNLDLSRPVGASPAQDFTGIRVDNGAANGPVTIKNCDLRRHRTGINIQGGKDYTVIGNDLRACGTNSEEPALYVSNITQLDGTIPMGLTASGNQFGTANSIVSNCGIRLENLCGIKITNVAGAGNHLVLNAADSIRTIAGTVGSYPSVIMLRNTSGVTIDSINLQWAGTQSGTGIYCYNDNASQYGNIIKKNIIKNRRLGLRTFNGSDYTIKDNDFQTTGIADDEPAIRMEHAAEGSLSGGVSISGNMFGGTNSLFGLKFVNMSNLKISDGTFAGTNVNLGLYGTNGLSEVAAGTGYVLHLSGVCNVEVNTLDLSRSGTTRQGTGIRLASGMGNTIQKVFAQGRDIGLQVAGSTSETIKCNAFYDNNFGMDFTNATISGLSLFNNSLMCNTTGLRNSATSTISATGNYWGASNGPSNLGGTGNGYTGSVNASGFLTSPDACASPLPNADAFGNNILIEDGDITPSFNDATIVCGIPVGQNIVTTYTIKNNGGGTIRLNGPNPVTVVPATAFTVDSQPSDLELSPGESTTLGIKFAPASVGLFTAIINVANKTCDNNPYNFTVQGNGCNAYTAVLSRDTAICQGNPGSVKITITGGTAPFTVILSDGSTQTVSVTGVSYIVKSPTSNTTYTITQVYDANNCCATISGSSMITVNALPSTNITVTETSGNSNNDGILCSGASATLDGGAFTSWLWNTIETTQTIIVSTAGTYTVTITDVNGCNATDTQIITVNPNPTPSIAVSETSGNANNDAILCMGDMATLDAGIYTSYVWSTSEITQSISTTAAATYTVTVTNSNGCIGTASQIITVNPKPAASLNDAILVCPGTTSVNLNINVTTGTGPFTVVLSDASSHNIATSGISQIMVTVSGPGQNVFTINSITDANGCSGTGSGSATVDFGSAGEIEISGLGIPIVDGDITPDPLDDTDFGPIGLGDILTHKFTITNSHSTDVLNISSLNLTGSSKFSILTFPASTVAANGGTTTFKIKFSPTDPGVVTASVHVNNSDCNENPYDFDLRGEGVCVDPMFTACPGPLTGNNETGVCYKVVSYTATATGTPAPTMMYSFTGATTGSGAGTGSGAQFNAGITNVKLTATNTCASAECNFTITITDTETPSIVCPGNQTRNAVSSCQYIAIGSEFNPSSVSDNCATTTSYTLTGVTTGSGATTLNGVAFNKGVTNVVWKVTDVSGNTNTCSFSVTVNNNLTASISVSETSELTNNDGTICSGDPVTLTASAGSAYSWNTGAVTKAITVNPTTTTTYTVTVTVANGCTATATKIINVTALPVVTCPANMNACLQGGTKTLSGATPSGGTYSGTGVSAGIFDPTVAGIGTHTITYSYTSPATNCSNSCTFTITVFTAPILNVNDNMYYCTLEEAVMATLTGDGDELQIPAGMYNEPCIHISKTLKFTPIGGMVEINCIMMEATGGKTLTLFGDVTIDNLTLTNGYIHTNGHHISCGAITGGSPASYIVTD